MTAFDEFNTNFGKIVIYKYLIRRFYVLLCFCVGKHFLFLFIIIFVLFVWFGLFRVRNMDSVSIRCISNFMRCSQESLLRYTFLLFLFRSQRAVGLFKFGKNSNWWLHCVLQSIWYQNQSCALLRPMALSRDIAANTVQ